MPNTQTTAVIPLPGKQKALIQLGAVCLSISVACYGLALSTLTTPILEKMDAMGYVSIFTILSSLGITIMTPVGGKLGDRFGRKAIVLAAGGACILFGFGLAYAQSIGILMVCRFGLSVAQGAFIAAPYIIVGLINEKKDVPKSMGLLAMALSVGGFVGSIIAGALTDAGMLEMAILFPALPLLIGILLIGFLYPNDRTGKTSGPLIPVHLLRNRSYVAFLLVGFFCYFYRSALDSYAPIASFNVMGASLTTVGSLQFPRAIVTMILPVAAGVWVSKDHSNMWKAMAIAAVFSAFPMLLLSFTTESTSIWLYFAAFTLTGIAESFRGVSITPAAQQCLRAEEMGMGTSLVNFVNSLATSLAVVLYGAIYSGFTNADPNSVINIKNGVNAIFFTAGGITLIGLLIVLFWVRPMLNTRGD